MTDEESKGVSDIDAYTARTNPLTEYLHEYVRSLEEVPNPAIDEIEIPTE